MKKTAKKFVDKIFEFDGGLAHYFRYGSRHRIHINFGRYKKGRKADTSTIYCSIMSDEKPYTEIWLDKQGKCCIGAELMWDSTPKRKGG